MRKLIFSSLVLASIAGNTFALTCPSIKDVVHGTRWVIPQGWMLHNEMNMPTEVFPIHIVSADKYGELTCRYMSLNSMLEIKKSNATGIAFKFDENWRTLNESKYFCTYNDDNASDCSFDIER